MERFQIGGDSLHTEGDFEEILGEEKKTYGIQAADHSIDVVL